MYHQVDNEHRRNLIPTATQSPELTDRQQEVLDLLRPPHNLAAREIGERLGISRNAVYQTINRLKKLGVWSSAPAAVQPSTAPRATETVLEKITQGGADGAPARRQENTTPGPLSATLLSELTQTQQELARIANRLAKYLS